MEFSEYLGILLTALSILVTVITFWISKNKKLQDRILNVLLVCIFAVVIMIIIAAVCSQIGECTDTSEPTEITPSSVQSEETTEPEATIPKETLIPSNVRVGDTITFGTYEKDNRTVNGAEEITWLILAKEDNRILVLSLYGLDSQLYNKTYKAVTWETSTIRQWLNEGFYNDAFSPEEQELILLSKIQPGNNPDKDCDNGMDTEDHVFLLSLDEVKTYIKENGLITSDVLLCRPTEYASKAMGAYKNDKGFDWWWLRTSANNNFSAYSVNSDGTIVSNGTVNSPNAAIRPAMWLYIG